MNESIFFLLKWPSSALAEEGQNDPKWPSSNDPSRPRESSFLTLKMTHVAEEGHLAEEGHF